MEIVEKVKAYNIVTGQISSYLEGGVFQQIFGGEAVSTMHILQKANMHGIKIYHINQENADSIIPQLQYNTAKKQMFRNLVNSGKEITVPEKNVTIGDWTGTGYIALNPENGTGTYMIDGGLNGGFFALLEMILLIILIIAVSTLVVYLAPYIVAFLKVYIIGLKNILLSLFVGSCYVSYKVPYLPTAIIGGLSNVFSFFFFLFVS